MTVEATQEIDVDSMEAGRELDLLIEEKVMGWRQLKRLPFYSTKITDAWELVEKMRALYCLQMDTVGFEGEEFRVLIGWSDDPISVWGMGPTAPLAICRAALKAQQAVSDAPIGAPVSS